MTAANVDPLGDRTCHRLFHDPPLLGSSDPCIAGHDDYLHPIGNGVLSEHPAELLISQ